VVLDRQCGQADYRLVAMDMDSTLITIECIDEIATCWKSFTEN
jgi:phosphoserine phosphatase